MEAVRHGVLVVAVRNNFLLVAVRSERKVTENCNFFNCLQSQPRVLQAEFNLCVYVHE